MDPPRRPSGSFVAPTWIAPIDRALLTAEWVAGPGGAERCPSCGGAPPGHADGCAHDEALSSRGWTTQPAREDARRAIERGVSPTDPPPA